MRASASCPIAIESLENVIDVRVELDTLERTIRIRLILIRGLILRSVCDSNALHNHLEGALRPICRSSGPFHHAFLVGVASRPNAHLDEGRRLRILLRPCRWDCPDLRAVDIPICLFLSPADLVCVHLVRRIIQRMPFSIHLIAIALPVPVRGHALIRALNFDIDLVKVVREKVQRADDPLPLRGPERNLDLPPEDVEASVCSDGVALRLQLHARARVGHLN